MIATMSRAALGATLPSHEPLSILVLGDAVNPNRLTPEELTEPGDFGPALNAADSGLNVRAVVTVDSQCADDALAALEGSAPPQVVLYFAHRAAKLCDGQDGQNRLVAAMSQGLARGLGVVVFHHGLYGDLYTPGAKDTLLQLVGAESSGLSWDQTTGQRVFIVGPDHFVATNGISPTGFGSLGSLGGVPSGSYPYFDNVPDERYPETKLLSEPGEERDALFATDSGGVRLLGYALHRVGWSGRVVAYQPGEYQPNALDDRTGNNFQILANALYYAALGEPDTASSNETVVSATSSDAAAAPGSDGSPEAPTSPSASADHSSGHVGSAPSLTSNVARPSAGSYDDARSETSGTTPSPRGSEASISPASSAGGEPPTPPLSGTTEVVGTSGPNCTFTGVIKESSNGTPAWLLWVGATLALVCRMRAQLRS